MAILVDELREYPGVRLPFTHWCHMATDGGFDELHAFAARLGLRRAWFQGDHYDLPPHRRTLAVVLGAEEVGTGELLARMTGPRGDRTRRRVLLPRGLVWLAGDDGPRSLRYPAGDLVVIGGPSGAGKSALAARAVDRTRIPLLDPDDVRAALGGDAVPWPAALGRWEDCVALTIAAGRGAVAVTPALWFGHRDRLARLACTAGCGVHLLLLDADLETCRAGRAAQGPPRIPDGLFEHLHREWTALRRTLVEPGDRAGVRERFVSVAVLDRAAADRLRRIAVG
jgi:predicted kinase